MSESTVHDPYFLDPGQIENPPRKLGAIMRRIGPGLILASSIVGSGELIATTVLGAENGYKLLWLIVISCAIKTVVQNELGRHAIGTSETTLESFDAIPGPRWRVSWVAWCWFFMVLMTMMQVGGMLGGISEVLNRMVPSVPVMAWVWIVNFATVILLIVGRYALVEKVAMGLVVAFTMLTVSCAVLLFQKPEYFSMAQVFDGLIIQMPEGGLMTAVATFGITGVGATELIMYPYWCIEKGYARFAGPRDDSAAWVSRAFGWIRVMGVDVLTSMVIYTFATIAFYLLGAGILHGMGIVPQGSEMVHMLSNMYTETLGSWSLVPFLAGAFAVLYSTVFASTAAHCRIFADFFGMLGVYNRRNYTLRLKATRIFVVILLFIPSMYFMWLESPVLMVMIGGLAQAVMLPVIAFCTIYLNVKRTPKSILPKGWIKLLLWISAGVMAVMMTASAIQKLMS